MFVLFIFVYRTLVRKKIRKKGERESETHASSFFVRVRGEATGFKGRLLLLLSSVLKRAEINSWVQ